MEEIIERLYGAEIVYLTNAGFVNVTRAAAIFGKNPNEWMRLKSTKEYIEALEETLLPKNEANSDFKCGNFPHLKADEGKVIREIPASLSVEASTDDVPSRIAVTLRGRHGSGTFLHPTMAIAFARWLDPRFAVWCDLQIKALLEGRYQDAITATEALKDNIQTLEQKNDALKAIAARAKGHPSTLWMDDYLRHEQQAKDAQGNARYHEAKVEILTQALSAVEDQIPFLARSKHVDKIKHALAWKAKTLKAMDSGEFFSTRYFPE